MNKKYVFLTKGEICISNETQLYVHLKESDVRYKFLSKNLKDICLFIINPNLSEYLKEKYSDKIKRNTWYTLDDLSFDYESKYSEYAHITFKFRLNSSYTWDGKSSLTELSSTFSPDVDKIEKLRKFNYE